MVGCFLKVKMTTCSHMVEKWADIHFLLQFKREILDSDGGS